MRRKIADTLVTGGTGFLGRWLVTSLTRHQREVVVLARGGAARAAALSAFVAAHGGDPDRLTVVDGDLTQAGLGLREPLDAVQDVYHLAAAFAFGMTAVAARAVNVEGTLHLAQWASERPRLRRLVHLGGYRTTMLPGWLAGAAYPLPPRVRARLYARHGAYEASKLEAHLALWWFATQHDLPLTSVHPSSVIGSSVTGETSQLTGIGETVERLWRGALPALVGSERTFVPVVCVDYLAELMTSVPTRPETLGQQLCVLDSRTPRLPALVRSIASSLGVPAPKVTLPRWAVTALPRAMTGIDRESLGFLSEDTYDTASADAHAAAVGLTMPSTEVAIERWAGHLVSTRFGRHADADPGRNVTAGTTRTFVVGDPSSADWIFLHGLPWNGDSGRALGQRLTGAMARADLPGMGRSSAAAPPGPNWLAALLSGRADPAVLVAHSLSTGIVVRFAARHAARVRGLVLISPYFLQRAAPWFLRFAPLAPLTGKLLAAGDALALHRRLLGPAGEADPAVVSAMEDLARPGVATRVARSLARASRSRERAALAAELAGLAAPVLIIHGERDPLLAPPSRGEVVSIAASGHNPHLESPEAVGGAIERWRGSLPAR